MKTLSKAVAIASLLSAGIMSAQVANADVEYSAGIASTYLWRGTDLGGAAFSAAADYSHDSGAYAGLWASSGDTGTGNEYDLYVGFAKEFGAVSVDAGLYTYVYNKGTDDAGNDDLGSAGELSEAIISVGFMDGSVTYIDNLGDADYSYIALGYSVAGVDLTYGISDNGLAGADESSYSHLDISYGLTEELAITVSQPIEGTIGAAADAFDTDTIVVMSYSIALK